MGKKRKTYREKVYMIISQTGGITTDATSILEGTYSYKAKVMSELKKRGITEKVDGITRFTRDTVERGITGYKDTEGIMQNAGKARDYLIKHKEGQKVRRLNLQGQVIAVMQEAGIKIDISQKGVGNNIMEENTYVISRGIKEEETESGDIKAAKRSRVMGTIFTPRPELYSVYLHDGVPINWDERGERAYRRETELYWEMENGNPAITHGIFIEGAKGFNQLIGMEEWKSVPKFRSCAWDVYKEMLVLPKSNEGAKILSLLIEPDIHAKLDCFVFPNGARQPQGTTADNLTADNVYECNLLYPDAIVFNRFSTGAQYLPEKSRTRVHCYPAYESAVREAVPEAEVCVHSVREVKEWLGIEEPGR